MEPTTIICFNGLDKQKCTNIYLSKENNINKRRELKLEHKEKKDETTITTIIIHKGKGKDRKTYKEQAKKRMKREA